MYQLHTVDLYACCIVPFTSLIAHGYMPKITGNPWNSLFFINGVEA